MKVTVFDPCPELLCPSVTVDVKTPLSLVPVVPVSDTVYEAEVAPETTAPPPDVWTFDLVGYVSSPPLALPVRVVDAVHEAPEAEHLALEPVTLTVTFV